MDVFDHVSGSPTAAAPDIFDHAASLTAPAPSPHADVFDHVSPQSEQPSDVFDHVSDLNAVHPQSGLPNWLHLANQEIATLPPSNLTDQERQFAGDPRKAIMAKWEQQAHGTPITDPAYLAKINEGLSPGQQVYEKTLQGATGFARMGLAPLHLVADTPGLDKNLNESTALGGGTFGNKFASGVGAAIPTLATAAMGPTPAQFAGIAGVQGAGEAAAEGKGLPGIIGGGLLGAGEGLVTGKLLAGASGIAKGVANPIGRMATAIGVDAAGNAILGGGGQAVSNVMSGRPVGEDVGVATAVGAATGAGFGVMSGHHANVAREMEQHAARVNEVLGAPAQLVENPRGRDGVAMDEVAKAATGKPAVWYQSDSPRRAFFDPKSGRMYVNAANPADALEEAGHALFRGEIKPHVQSFIADNPETITQAADNYADRAEGAGEGKIAQKVREDTTAHQDEGFANTLAAGMTPEAIADLAKTNPGKFMQAYERVLSVVDKITGGNKAAGRLVERQLKQFIEPLRANLETAQRAIGDENKARLAEKVLDSQEPAGSPQAAGEANSSAAQAGQPAGETVESPSVPPVKSEFSYPVNRGAPPNPEAENKNVLEPAKNEPINATVPQAPETPAPPQPQSPVDAGRVEAAAKEPAVMSEEDYLSSKGAGQSSMGDLSLAGRSRGPGGYRNSNSSEAALERQSAKDMQIVEQREKLRKEYADKVAAGELRPPTRRERLEATAAGHPDRQDVQAARRLLARDYPESSAPVAKAGESAPVAAAGGAQKTSEIIRNPITEAAEPAPNAQKAPTGPVSIEPISDRYLIVKGSPKHPQSVFGKGDGLGGNWDARRGGYVFSKTRQGEVQAAVDKLNQAETEPTVKENLTVQPRFTPEETKEAGLPDDVIGKIQANAAADRTKPGDHPEEHQGDDSRGAPTEAVGSRRPQTRTAPQKLYSRAGLEQRLLAWHQERAGEGLQFDRSEEMQQDAGTDMLGPEKFTFHEKLPQEVKTFLEGRPAARSLFRVTNDQRAAKGADVMGAMEGKKPGSYFDMAEEAAAGKAGTLRDAVESARKSDDPSMQFLAAVHDTLSGPAKDRKPFAEQDASKLSPGNKFTFQGEKFRVVEDEQGMRVLEDGGDYPEVPLDWLDKVPVDKGTLKKGRAAKPAEIIPNPIPENYSKTDVTPASTKFFDPSAEGIKTGEGKGIFGQTTFDPATGNKQGGLFHEPVKAERSSGDTAADAKIRGKFSEGESATGKMFEMPAKPDDDIPFSVRETKPNSTETKLPEPETDEAQTETATKPLFARIAQGAKSLYQHATDRLGIDPLKPMRRISPEAETAAKVHASSRIFAPVEERRLTAMAAPEHYKDDAKLNDAREIMNLDNVLYGHNQAKQAGEKLLSQARDADEAYSTAREKRKWVTDPELKQSLNDEIRKQRALGTDLHRQAKAALERADAIEESAANRGTSIPEMLAKVKAAKDDPAISSIISGYIKHIQPELDAHYNRIKGVDPNTPRDGRGLIFGARVNLMTKAREAELRESLADPEKPLPSASSSNYRNPAAKGDRYDQRASFTGDYSNDWHMSLLDVLGNRINEGSKLDFYDALEKGGIAVRPDKLAEGEEEPKTIGGQPVVRMPIEVPETNEAGATRQVKKTMLVRQDMVRSIRDVLATDQSAPHGVVAKALNTAQLLQWSDAITHFKNQTAFITRAEGAGSVWRDAVKKIPILGTGDALKQQYDVMQEIVKDTPEIRTEMAELAKEGNLRPDYASGKIPVMKQMGDLLHLNDTAVRILAGRYHKSLVARGKAQDTPQSRYDFINQIGQYNTRLMGPVMRWFKQFGLSPFVVAGRNITAGSIKAITGDPGYHPTTRQAAVSGRAMMLMGLGMAGATTALLNMATTGQAGGRSGTPLGAWDLGTDEDDGKHKIIDMLQLSGIRRGLRSTGLNSAIEGIREGKDANQIIGQGLEDVSQSALHPWIGPAPSFAFKALTGRQLDIRGRMEAQQIPGGGGAQYLENARAALESQNPFLYALARPGFKAAGLDQKPADEDQSFLGGVASTVMKSANQAVGLKDVKPGQDAAETMAERLAQAKFGSGAPSPDDSTKIALHRKLLAALKADPDAGQAAIDKAVEDGDLSERAAANLAKKAGMSALDWNLKSLGAADAARVYEAADDDEKDQIREAVVNKVAGSKELSAEKQDELLADLGIDAPDDLAVKREFHALNTKARAYAAARKAALAGDRSARARLVSLRLSQGEQSRLARLKNVSAAITKAKKEGAVGKVKRLVAAA